MINKENLKQMTRKRKKVQRISRKGGGGGRDEEITISGP